MAPFLSRSLGTSSVSACGFPSSPLVSNPRRALSFRSSFLPRYGLPKKGFPSGGLRWKVGKSESRMVVRCDAAVADTEAEEASGEKFEYQAEVWFHLSSQFRLAARCSLSFVGES